MSNDTTSNNIDAPMFPPIRTGKARLDVRIPERTMPIVMKVRAGIVWVTAPANTPHRHADQRLPVHFLALWRTRRLVKAFRC